MVPSTFRQHEASGGEITPGMQRGRSLHAAMSFESVIIRFYTCVNHKEGFHSVCSSGAKGHTTSLINCTPVLGDVSVCGRRRSGVAGLMNGGGVAEIRGCGEREEETTLEEIKCGGDEAFGGAQGVKEREM